MYHRINIQIPQYGNTLEFNFTYVSHIWVMSSFQQFMAMLTDMYMLQLF